MYSYLSLSIQLTSSPDCIRGTVVVEDPPPAVGCAAEAVGVEVLELSGSLLVISRRGEVELAADGLVRGDWPAINR